MTAAFAARQEDFAYRQVIRNGLARTRIERRHAFLVALAFHQKYAVQVAHGRER